MHRRNFRCRWLRLPAMCLVLAGCGTGDNNPAGAPPPPEVTVVTLATRDLPLNLSYPARIAGSKEVEVRARVSGILLERVYREGEHVREGDLLFRLDPASFEAAVARARANLAVESARFEQAKRELERRRPLAEQGILSQRDLDTAQADYAVAEASVKAARAALQTAELDLSWTEVRAPISGLTSKEVRSEGSLVTAGAESSLLTYIVQVDPLYVEFAVPAGEADLIQNVLRQDSPQARRSVAIELGDGRMLDTPATIDFLDTAVDQTTGTVPVRATLPNPDRELLPGQFVRAHLRGAVLEQVIVVPRRALLSGPEGPYVWVVDGENKVRSRPIRVGRASLNEVVASDGVNAGERVIVEGVLKVQAGVTVAAIEGPDGKAATRDAVPGGPAS